MEQARAMITNKRAVFKAGNVETLEEATKPTETLSFYVWDYPGVGVGFIDLSCSVAGALTSEAVALKPDCMPRNCAN